MGQRIGSNNSTILNGTKKLTNRLSGTAVPQFVDEDVEINVNVAPMTLLIPKLGIKRDIRDSTYSWLEHDNIPVTVDLNEDMDTTETGMDVATGFGGAFQANQLWIYYPTNEIVKVASVSTDTVTVVRAFNGDGSTGYAMANGDSISLLGTAYPESSTPGTGITVEPKKFDNYPQTFRQFIDGSRRMLDAEVYGARAKGSTWARMKKNALKSLMMQKENCFFFNSGGRASETATTGPGSITNGAVHYISTNTYNLGGSLTFDALETYAEAMYRRNAGEAKNLYAFCGPNFKKGLDSLGRDNLRQSIDDNKTGLDIMTFDCSFGPLKAVLHPMWTVLNTGNAFTGIDPSTSSTLDPGTGSNALNTTGFKGGGPIGMLVWLNMSLVGEAHYAGQTLEFQDEIQVTGTDGKKAGYIEDVGFILEAEKQHLMAYGIDAP